MEFKFRAVDDRSSTHLPPSSGVSDQPFRGGYPSANPRGILDPADHQQAIQRQLEKERIREEIMAAGLARRRALEAEVRMELMMERQMVMRRAAEFGLSLEERVAMRFDPRYPFMIPHPVNGWVLEDTQLPLPPMQQLPEAASNKLKPEPNKDKVIFLAKPNPSLSGAKRKAEIPAVVGASELSSSDSTKQPKEWSCALCKVSAPSEKGLNEHLEGKRHKTNEARLGAERAAKKPTSGHLPKETGKPKPADADIPLQIIQNAEQVKKEKFKCWCELCKVGAHSERVMEDHKKGKKHVDKLKRISVNSTQEGKDADTAKEANQKPAEDA